MEIRHIGRVAAVGDELSVAVDDGELWCAGRLVPAAFYTSDGFARRGHREVFFAVLRGDRSAPLPRFPVAGAAMLYRMAVEGRMAEPGDLSRLAGSALDSDPRISAFTYLEAMQQFPTSARLDVPPLVVLPVIGDEAAVVSRYGYARLLALLGRGVGYFPYPWWFTPGRSPVADPIGYDGTSVLAGIPVFRMAPIEVSHLADAVRIVMRSTDRARVTRALREAPEVCGFLPGPARTTGTYVWEPGQRGPAIAGEPTPEGPAEIGCNHLIISRDGHGPAGHQVEDGILLRLTDALHARLADAVEAGEPVEIGLPAGDVRRVILGYRDPGYLPPFGVRYALSGDHTVLGLDPALVAEGRPADGRPPGDDGQGAPGQPDRPGSAAQPPDAPHARPSAAGESRLKCCMGDSGNAGPDVARYFHTERHDAAASGWRRMVELIERAAADGRTEFAPLRELTDEERRQVVTLPPTVARLTSVRRFDLMGADVVRLPPEIGAMASLESLDLYMSYRLHWLPYEITRCTRLRDTRFSTRSLYGNEKFRPAFPRLRPPGTPVPGWSGADLDPGTWGATTITACGVCRRPIGPAGPHQVWISVRVGTDVLPLLVNACSDACVTVLPAPAPGYAATPHTGGPELVQPRGGYPR